jgi:hypothetical protein
MKTFINVAALTPSLIRRTTRPEGMRTSLLTAGT